MNQEAIERPMPNSYGGEIIASGATVQQVRSAYTTAVSVQRPRQLKEVARRVAEEAALAGEDFYYGWRAGSDTVEGPSVKMAMALARHYGNCAVDVLPVQDLADCWIFAAVFVDLETGFTLTRQFRQSKDWKVHGKLDEERKDDVRFQIGASKAARNVILNAIPTTLVTRALEAAKQGVRDELDRLIKDHGLVKVADRLLSALGKCGVKERAVLAKCGVADRKALTRDHLVTLRGDLNALQSGQERVEVLFPAVEEQQAMAPEAEDAPKKIGRKVTKKTLAALNELAAKVALTPVDKEELCSQVGVHTFDEMTEESAASIIHDLAEALRRREEAAQQREPGSDDPDEPR